MESIGQYISDMTQTPEGLASLIGIVLGVIVVICVVNHWKKKKKINKETRLKCF